MATPPPIDLKKVHKEMLSGKTVLEGLTAGFERLNSEELLERIIHHFGGTDQFAYEMVAFYKETSSVMAKQRIMDMITRLYVTQTQLSKDAMPLENMDTEDLEALFASTLARVQPNILHDARVPQEALPAPDREAD